MLVATNNLRYERRNTMTPSEYEVLEAAAAGGRSAIWFEAPEQTASATEFVALGYIKKVDLSPSDTGAEPTHYRATAKGQALWERVKPWETAKSIVLREC